MGRGEKGEREGEDERERRGEEEEGEREGERKKRKGDMVCMCPHKIHILALDPQCDGIRRWGLGR